MNAPAYDLDGLPVPRRLKPDYDISPKRRKAPDFDLPPISLKLTWDLDVLLQKAPIPTVEYAAWLQEIQALAKEAAVRDADLHGSLGQMLAVLSSPFATVTFGGHFKTGKSTLLNAALGRCVLPAADLPETGAICVLQPGEKDSVEVCAGDSRRTIPCTLEAIQQETSLIGQVGERRTQVHKVERLEITLTGCGIPARARWLDSPGINDTEEMNECARRAARQADVLLWVLSSKQPLSEVEMEFLAAHIEERGPTGVVFVLNAFLAENTPEAWAAFLDRKAPWICDKVLYHAPDLGFTPEAPPCVAPVSGLGLFGDSENDFGRTELRKLLMGLGSPDVPRIRRARLGRVALELRALGHEIEESREKRRTEAETKRQTREQSHQATELRRPQFENELRNAVKATLDRWTAQARNSAGEILASITGMTLARDDRYSVQLNAALKRIAAPLTGGLLMESWRLAAAHGQPLHCSVDEERLRSLLSPEPVAVSVANTPVTDGAAQTVARVDGAVRSLLQPLGIKVNPALGATLDNTLGVHRETPEKRERDAAQTRLSVQEATEAAIKSVQSRQEEICALLLRGTAPNAESLHALSAPPLIYRDEKLEHLLRLSLQAERLAKQEIDS